MASFSSGKVVVFVAVVAVAVGTNEIAGHWNWSACTLLTELRAGPPVAGSSGTCSAAAVVAVVQLKSVFGLCDGPTYCPVD